MAPIRNKITQNLFGKYKGKNCVVFGASSSVGMGISRFLSQAGANLGLIDLESYTSDREDEDVNMDNGLVVKKTVLSGQEKSISKAVEDIVNTLDSVDYLILTFYFESFRKKFDPEILELNRWDEALRDWVFNYFLTAKAVVPHIIQQSGGRVVFVNTTYGYTGEGEGEGELTQGGSLYESACSSAITGMMTSIARDIIPNGVSVNGVSLGPNYKTDLERMIWAIELWLSGICDYACGQIIRLY
jgi:NAD(P)-dependent dehydrogenase (short-subunit alcohol dehydrogenase family)